MAIPVIKMATIGLLPSPLKILYYKLKGAKIGKNVSLGLFSVINSKKIEIGDLSKVGFGSFISCKTLKIGKRVKINSMVAIETGNVFIDNDSTIMEQVVIGGMLTPRSSLSIGKNVKIFPYSFINPTEPIEIGDEVGIGGSNYLFTHGSWQSELDGFPISFGPIKIEKGVWLPWRVFVLPNVTIGEYSTIGANSTIRRNVPPYSLAAGSPAKVIAKKEQYIKTFSEEEKNNKIVSYINSFIEFLNYTGIETKVIDKKETRLLFQLNIQKKTCVICYSYNIEYSENVNIFVSYNPIDFEVKKSILANNNTYFSIAEKETFFSSKKEWFLVRDFFSRYGVRFTVKD